MNSISQLRRRQHSGNLHIFPTERYSDQLVGRRGGLISAAGKLTSPWKNGVTRKLTKLLLNVNIERSLGPVHVVTSPENTVSDLIKAAIDIYLKEKRRPLLKHTHPQFFALHYSQFCLESLKADEKLSNLGSRNFFMCSKPYSNSVKLFWSEQAKMSINSTFPLTKFMDFLL
ncbi:hypothetical protein Patl1_36139 [Pistacia atlantica]|nr:hypothetical protein Patl1_36139 [Pistacia atlantica]